MQNWVFRVQREISRGMILDVRYVGNKSTHMWHYQNMNEVNIYENGFLQQFIAAQNNLAVNKANGKYQLREPGLSRGRGAADLRDGVRRQRLERRPAERFGFRELDVHHLPEPGTSRRLRDALWSATPIPPTSAG